MPQRRPRVVQIIRILQAAGPLKPRRKAIPRQQQPDVLRVAYWRALMPFIKVAKEELDRVKGEIFVLLRHENDARARTDASKEEQAQRLIDLAAKRTVDRMAPKAVHEVAKQFGQKTSAFQQAQLDKQTRAAFAVPLSSIEAAIPERLEEFAVRNVDLIVTVPERYFDRIRTDVLKAFEDGTTPAELADDFADRFGMAEDDAMRIARDQIGKLNAQLNQDRQEGMGVTQYIWRTAKDNRVRDNHDALDGETFNWGDPPMGGGTNDDEPGNPGEGIQCRCYAEPVFGAIKEQVEED